ncbi:histidine kinase [Solirubrobacter ginsenosidimutans]|uniref:histidine kinase n=1 Tax=Solirubrobacter ginsenosidimutans TaxID=490573 RepID=A0A9X3S2Q1_9ACTN|nr:histidine kinase [Solirubrobacter ginsenosidimutans]MDA0158833.1 histidine kinase [Solirubrobacter ginsenosidimutans]
MPPRRRLVLILGLPLVAVLGTAALVQARRHPEQALGGAGAGALALQLLAGFGACAAGADLDLRRSMRLSGGLLAASGVALLLGAVPLHDAGSAVLFTAALAGGAFAPAFAGAAAVCHPVAGRRLGTVVAGMAAAAVVVLGVVPTALFDPVASGCLACPRNLLLVHGYGALQLPPVSVAPWAQALLCGGLCVLAVGRWARRPALARRAGAPVAVGGALVAALGAAAFVHAAVVSGPRVDETARSLWLAQCALLALVATGVAVQALRARLLRGQIADIVVATLSSPERLREALARRLGDPGLAICFPGARNGPVDAEGRPSRVPSPGAATTEVVRGRQVVALLAHDAALTHAPDRLATAARGAGPALEHASLRARLRAELAELSASRTRIVEVADEERRRAERDLHDGAQQRLIALSVALAQVAHQDGSLARAADELRRALEDLRALAHGLHPASLTEAGIAAALGELGERSRVPVRLTALPSGRWPPLVEAALYRLVLDGVGCAERAGDGGVVVVAIEHVGAGLGATVTLPGVRAATASLGLEHVYDRIAALDGALTLHETVAGVHLEAHLPCGS